MVDEYLRKPRRKPKASLHLLESPLPVPIETICGKKSDDRRWYYYFGDVQSDHVSISRLGDLTFLYRLGFFGRGVFSRSQPQFEKYLDVLSDEARKRYMRHFSVLEPDERVPHQHVYFDIMGERLRQHNVWGRLEEEQLDRPHEIDGDEVDINKVDSCSLQCVDLHTEIDNLLVEEASSESEDIDNYILPSSGTKGCETNDSSVDTKREISRVDDIEICNIKTNETSISEDVSEVELNTDAITNNAKHFQTNENKRTDEVDTINTNSSTNVVVDKVDTCTVEKNRSKRPISQVSEGTVKKIKLEDSYKLYECLQLSFEEAFFLSFGLGCLAVKDEDNRNMTLTEMWAKFSAKQKDFIATYAAYHHFRSKGWVVRFSKVYGSDFLLYHDGVPFTHASYCVVVNFVHEHLFCLKDPPPLSWKQLGALCRINERGGKEVLFCNVIQPKDMREEDFSSPSCIKKLKIMEVVLRRWAPEKYRESKE